MFKPNNRVHSLIHTLLLQCPIKPFNVRIVV